MSPVQRSDSKADLPLADKLRLIDGTGSHTPTQPTGGIKLVLIKILDSLKYEEHVRATIETAMSVNDVVGAVFENIAADAEKVAHILEKVLAGVTVLGFIKSVKWWVSEKSNSIYETIAQIFLTTLKGIKSVIFFSYIGAFSLSKIAITIGKIPVIGMVVNVLAIGGYGAHLIKDVKEYSSASKELKRLQDIYDSQITELELSTSNEEVVRTLEAIEAQKIIVYTAKLDVINDVVNVVFSVLTIMAFCTGWGAIAMTGALMLSLSVSISVMWLYTCYYTEKHKDVKGLTVDAY